MECGQFSVLGNLVYGTTELLRLEKIIKIIKSNNKRTFIIKPYPQMQKFFALAVEYIHF